MMGDVDKNLTPGTWISFVVRTTNGRMAEKGLVKVVSEDTAIIETRKGKRAFALASIIGFGLLPKAPFKA